MATIHLIDLEGRDHWTDEDSPFAKSGLESGHLKRPGQDAEQVDETGEDQGDADNAGDAEQVDETGEEAEGAAVEQDSDGADAVGDASGSGDAKPSGRGSRRR